MTWVDEVVQRPVAFSVVREDSLQDIEVIRRYFPDEEVSLVMVASGGCTAAALLRVPLKSLTLVDPNPAQLALSKLKIQLLTLPLDKRLGVLGYRDMDPNQRKTILRGLMQALDIEEDALGPIDFLSKIGIDFIGRYERIFEEIRTYLMPYRSELEELFSLKDARQQLEQIAPQTQLGQAIDRAFHQVMSQENLTRIFGEKATANRVQEFSSHFVERLRTFLFSHLASHSPWVAHLFLGHFYRDQMFPWLKEPILTFPHIAYFHGTMDKALQQCEPESHHIVHLSNILDWLSPEEAKSTLALAFRALKPGGCVIIRQLNSNLEIPLLGKSFEWKPFPSIDRSFFYRHFHLGFKPSLSRAPKVTALADAVLNDRPILKGTYFQALPTMPKETFQMTQAQFCHAVDYFSRPMAALVARLPHHRDRLDIIHNIVEEHGDFDLEQSHSHTFRQFLYLIGTQPASKPSAPVQAFNSTLMGVCAHEDPILAIACNGIIEYAFADISAYIGQIAIDRGWIEKEQLVHYNLHADLDKRHAEEFFAVVEDRDPEKVLSGLQLGAYIFHRLYEDSAVRR